MYLCREMTTLPLKSIGSIFKKDHSTVLHGIKKVKEDTINNDDLKNTIDIIKEKILSI